MPRCTQEAPGRKRRGVMVRQDVRALVSATPFLLATVSIHRREFLLKEEVSIP
jgi:hypothetical protein